MTAVVTGMGLVTPLGSGVGVVWDMLLRGEVAFDAPRDDFALSAGIDHGMRVGNPPRDCPSNLSCRYPVLDFAIAAAAEALQQAQLIGLVELRSADVIVGTGGALRSEWDRSLGQDPESYPPPPLQIYSGLADAVATYFCAAGLRTVVNTACSASTTALAIALDRIACGDTEIAIVCGADEWTAFSAVGFDRLGAYSKTGCAPYRKSDGLTLGEGAGALILESEASARRRFARPLGYVLGGGLSGDAHHATAPDPTGGGALLAIRRALESAGVAAMDIGFVVGHGTGTKANDAVEGLIHRNLFAERGARVPLVSVKGAMGHTLGACGAIEAIVALKTASVGRCPPTSPVQFPRSVEGDVLVLDRPTAIGSTVGLSANYAFGGHNACVVVSRNRPVPAARRDLDAVAIVGMWATDRPTWSGDELEGGAGTLANLSRRLSRHNPIGSDNFADTHSWRRMGQLSRLSVSALAAGVGVAGLDTMSLEPDDLGLVFATCGGPADAADELHASVDSGQRPNPAVYANLALTATCGWLSRVFRIRGPQVTVTAGACSGLQGLSIAANWVRLGIVSRAVVVASDVATDFRLSDPTLSLADGRIDSSPPIAVSVCVCLEAYRSASERGAVPIARCDREVFAGGELHVAGNNADLWTDVVPSMTNRATTLVDVWAAAPYLYDDPDWRRIVQKSANEGSKLLRVPAASGCQAAEGLVCLMTALSSINASDLLVDKRLVVAAAAWGGGIGLLNLVAKPTGVAARN